MKLELYQVDAFTDKLFGGNPAAVVPLKEWLPDDLMQLLALENNLSETVFFAPGKNTDDFDFEIRWFTPQAEINLCGHATLAAAYILFTRQGFEKEMIRFNSKSGLLTITRSGKLLKMDFPAWVPAALHDVPAQLYASLGLKKIESLHRYRDLLVELPDEQAVVNCRPDFNLLKQMPEMVIITAPGDDCDFVSRFFAPQLGVDEDPVTGSAHSQLIPYWAERLNKKTLHAKQLSPRGGELWCEYLGDRVTISGSCVFYMKGEFEILH